jgi:hypothetical protein
MTDINLNPQLTARLRAVQQHWGHDNISETLALILDAVTNKWDIPIPNTAHILVEKPARVRLKARHVAYFTQMSQMSGLNVAELARSVLIQWICLPQNTLMLPEHTQKSPEHTQMSPQSRNLLPDQTHKSPEATRKRSNKPTPTPKRETVTQGETQTSPQNTQMSPQNIEVPPEQPVSSPKTTGRSALSGLLKNK